MVGHAQFDDEEHIETSPHERLIHMANQIARFWVSQKHEAAVTGMSEHIAKYWDPRMRANIRAHLAGGGAGLGSGRGAEALGFQSPLIPAKAGTLSCCRRWGILSIPAFAAMSGLGALILSPAAARSARSLTGSGRPRA
jgi:formate dehydrogenase subunit delta